MANIKITANSEIYDGMPITFRAPCDSAVVEGLKVCTANVTQTFTLRDAHGQALTNPKDLFSTGTYVTAILDTTNSFAYIQNGDTNTYIEGRFKALANGIPNVNIDATLSIEGAVADAKAVGDALTILANRPSVSVDATLSKEGAAADAKAVGDALIQIGQRPTETDFSDWNDGYFTVQMADGTTKDGSVIFDSEGNPKSVTLNGHTMAITLPV